MKPEEVRAYLIAQGMGKHTMKAREGYLVRGACGREWFVPLLRVRDDYADFLQAADSMTPSEALQKANEFPEFWHTWFFEQCQEWEDIERLGEVIKSTGVLKTKAAMNRRRGKNLDYAEIKLALVD